ncbi:MAG: hypothetical protein AAFN65_13120, partial [Bacteroidota bacterium]
MRLTSTFFLTKLLVLILPLCIGLTVSAQTSSGITFDFELAANATLPDCGLPNGPIDFTQIRPDTDVIECTNQVLDQNSDGACVDMGFLPAGISISYGDASGLSEDLVLVGSNSGSALPSTFIGANSFQDTTKLNFSPSVASVSFDVIINLSSGIAAIEFAIYDDQNNLISTEQIPNNSNEIYTVTFISTSS